MFTLKFYDGHNFRTRIEAADSLTILRDNSAVEITLHRKSGDDLRVDVTLLDRQEGWPQAYHRAIIENGAGKTTEIIDAPPINVKRAEPDSAPTPSRDGKRVV